MAKWHQLITRHNPATGWTAAETCECEFRHDHDPDGTAWHEGTPV